MSQHELRGSTPPKLSIVIPVYNDWAPLARCLQSLARQTNAPNFEVLVVDDGSEQPAPQSILTWNSPYPFRILHQPHSGIPAARNRGIGASRATLLLFVDADCRLDTHCLAALDSAVSRSPQHNCFQLRLAGDRSSLVGRAEELRLSTFQNLMLQPDSRIRYLNTAGFSIRRSRISSDTLFNPAALRAEDTLLLADLMQTGELPLFVPDAIVEHTIPLSLLSCLGKDIRTVSLESGAYGMIASRGVKIRVSHQERLQLLRSMWKAAGQDSIGRSAWFVVVVRQTLQRIASFLYRCFRGRATLPSKTAARQSDTGLNNS